MEQDESGSPQAGPAAEAPALEPRDTLLPQGACDTGCHAGPFQKATGPRVPPPGFLAAPPPGASRGQDRACLAAPLLEAKSATVPRQASGVRSPGQTGWAYCRAGCPGAPSPHRTGQGCVFCMGPENRAKCGCCSLKPSPWAAGDSPTQGRHGPRPLCAHSTLSWGGQDHMDGQILSQLRPLAEEEEEAGAGSAPSARPAFPGMGSEELRLASFYDWPLSAVVRPELLAAAGFFHTGESWGPGHRSRCFWAGRHLLHGVRPPRQGGSWPDAEGPAPPPPALPCLPPPVPPMLQTNKCIWEGPGQPGTLGPCRGVSRGTAGAGRLCGPRRPSGYRPSGAPGGGVPVAAPTRGLCTPGHLSTVGGEERRGPRGEGES